MTTAEMNTNILSLTEYQRKQIAAQLQEYLQLNHELQDTTPQVCPRCGQHGAFIKKGFSGNKQRYQCKCCGKKFYLSGCNPAHTSSHGCSIYSQNIPFKQLQRQGNRRLSSNRGKSWKRVIVKPVKSFTIDKKSFDLG